jgi:hypothetical protein
MAPVALTGWLCLAAASLAACHAGAIVACDTEYASPAGFSVRCPSGFQATDQVRQVDGLGLGEALFEDTSDDDRYTHEMAAGRTDLAPGTSLDEFAAQEAVSAKGDGFSEPTATTGAMMDGEPALRMTYTTTAAPLGYFILENMKTCQDGRFCLNYEGPGVHVVRVITVHKGAGYWLTLFAAPGREADGRLPLGFAARGGRRDVHRSRVRRQARERRGVGLDRRARVGARRDAVVFRRPLARAIVRRRRRTHRQRGEMPGGGCVRGRAMDHVRPHVVAKTRLMSVSLPPRSQEPGARVAAGLGSCRDHRRRACSACRLEDSPPA